MTPARQAARETDVTVSRISKVGDPGVRAAL
jgi:hypothetical protein